METRKTFKVHVPFIEKDYVVEDWTDGMAVDQVLDTLLSQEERAIVFSHIFIDCDVKEIKAN